MMVSPCFSCWVVEGIIWGQVELSAALAVDKCVGLNSEGGPCLSRVHHRTGE